MHGGDVRHLLNMISVDLGSARTRFRNVDASEKRRAMPARFLHMQVQHSTAPPRSGIMTMSSMCSFRSCEIYPSAGVPLGLLA